MYFKRNYKDIRDAIDCDMRDAGRRLDCWLDVFIEKKLDGTEYKQLSRGLKHAKLTQPVLGNPECTIYYYSPKFGYCNESIRAYFWDEESHAEVAMNAEQLRRAISEHIEYLRQYITELRHDLSILEETYTEFTSAISDANDKLFAKLGKHSYYMVASNVQM